MATLAAVRDFVWKHVPTRESIESNRFLRPLAPYLSHPNLWHMNQRSVPRAVALGLGVGVIIPVMHTLVVAVLAIPTRANITIAALATLVINPLTIPPLYWAAYRFGKWELHRGNDLDPSATANVSGEMAKFLFWIHHASGPIAVGILTISAIVASLGYVISGFVWRRWRMGRWHARREGRAATRRSSM